MLSPRGRERAARLAELYSSVNVAADNQSAVSEAATVLLCVRPQDAEDIMAALEFRPDHQVVSLMAKVSLAAVKRQVAPANDVARALPNPAVATRHGVTPVYPGGSVTDALFDNLGTALPLDDERLLVAASVASATVATHLSYVRTAAQWLSSHGMAAVDADRYVTSIFAGVGSELRDVADVALLAVSHSTPGGLNERVEQRLREAGLGLLNDPVTVGVRQRVLRVGS